MFSIKKITQLYAKRINSLDLELILAYAIGKSHEFVLAHPKHPLTQTQRTKCEDLIHRREKHEPLAYILGHKEFYGLDFKVTPNTLIPRPETEMLVSLVLRNMLRSKAKNETPTTIIDVGTGSGNIIISIAKEVEKTGLPFSNYTLLATDISQKALAIAKQNAKKNDLAKKIKFIHSDLLKYFLKNKKNLSKHKKNELIIVSNLPYLSEKIYAKTKPSIKNFEPKSALYSPQKGLAHYEKLFIQIKKLEKKYSLLPISCFVEFSPEQKISLSRLINKYFPERKTHFQKDLAGKWRVARISFK